MSSGSSSDSSLPNPKRPPKSPARKLSSSPMVAPRSSMQSSLSDSVVSASSLMSPSSSVSCSTAEEAHTPSESSHGNSNHTLDEGFSMNCTASAAKPALGSQKSLQPIRLQEDMGNLSVNATFVTDVNAEAPLDVEETPFSLTTTQSFNASPRNVASHPAEFSPPHNATPSTLTVKPAKKPRSSFMGIGSLGFGKKSRESSLAGSFIEECMSSTPTDDFKPFSSGATPSMLSPVQLGNTKKSKTPSIYSHTSSPRKSAVYVSMEGLDAATNNMPFPSARIAFSAIQIQTATLLRYFAPHGMSILHKQKPWKHRFIVLAAITSPTGGFRRYSLSSFATHEAQELEQDRLELHVNSVVCVTDELPGHKLFVLKVSGISIQGRRESEEVRKPNCEWFFSMSGADELKDWMGALKNVVLDLSSSFIVPSTSSMISPSIRTSSTKTHSRQSSTFDDSTILSHSPVESSRTAISRSNSMAVRSQPNFKSPSARSMGRSVSMREDAPFIRSSSASSSPTAYQTPHSAPIAPITPQSYQGRAINLADELDRDTEYGEARYHKSSPVPPLRRAISHEPEMLRELVTSHPEEYAGETEDDLQSLPLSPTGSLGAELPTGKDARGFPAWGRRPSLGPSISDTIAEEEQSSIGPMNPRTKSWDSRASHHSGDTQSLTIPSVLGSGYSPSSPRSDRRLSTAPSTESDRHSETASLAPSSHSKRYSTLSTGATSHSSGSGAHSQGQLATSLRTKLPKMPLTPPPTSALPPIPNPLVAPDTPERQQSGIPRIAADGSPPFPRMDSSPYLDMDS